jgi:hypothetical protein
MNASSSKTLVIALGGLGLLAVVVAASKAKAAQLATDSDPELTPPGPPTPHPSLPSDGTTPAVPLDHPELENPPTHTPPVTAPAVLEQPSLDPYIDPPGPPIPSDMAAVTLPPPLTMQQMLAMEGQDHPTPNPAAMPTYPVTVNVPNASPVAKKKPQPLIKRPFGNDPIDVTATSANVAPSSSVAPHGAAPVPSAKRSAGQAALELLAYVTPILAAKRGSELGLKNHPNAVVKAAQLDMGDVPADGIYGPRTRAKGTALTGKKFPARV